MRPTMVADGPRISDSSGVGCTPMIPIAAQRLIVEEMAINGSKWDIQVGDTQTLCPFALTLSAELCGTLFTMAEALTVELMVIEKLLAERNELWPALGLQTRVRQVLEIDAPWTPAAARVIRYDFHPTDRGWRISEANSDVPGGLNESSTYSELVAQHFGTGFRSSGDTLTALATRLAAACGRSPCVGLVAAPGYGEDQQVVVGIARELERQGLAWVRITPEQLRWEDARAYAKLGSARYDLGAIFRFFQGEWSTRVHSDVWRFVFKGGKTPVCNPGTSILTESKRLPLVWGSLPLALPTWQRLLPATQGVWHAAFRPYGDWVFKDAYSNTGDAVTASGWSSPRDRLLHLAGGMIRPGRSLAQERFNVQPVETPLGEMYPCLGVYTLDGKATGIYGRISRKPVIDYEARDVAVLIRS